MKVPPLRILPGPPARTFACPVAISLQRNSQGGLSLLFTTGKQDEEHPRRSVQVSLQSNDGRAIASADITLHAARITDHAQPARVVFGATDEADRIEKTYHVEQDKSPSTSLVRDLDLLDTMAGVESATIKSVTFADGSVFRSTGSSACTATPQNFLEVAGR